GRVVERAEEQDGSGVSGMEVSQDLEAAGLTLEQDVAEDDVWSRVSNVSMSGVRSDAEAAGAEWTIDSRAKAIDSR
ncbi:MAG TPA: hypothetical protein VLM76_03445, partial [Patescibacteria group bacterium]|nr:hypothetical protein [Patescibacteria group bacterium]